MNTLSAILSRRTIRNFNGKDIDEGELRAILGAAYASPVGRKRYDTLTLTVVKNKDFLTRCTMYVRLVILLHTVVSQHLPRPLKY